MRFRKSIRICKGIKVNFSKSGASFTTGIPGFSFTTGRKGVYLNAGIPGTGLYSRTKLGGSSGVKRKTHSATKRTISTGINLHMDDNGFMSFAYSDGRLITDQSMIRKIKATPQYKNEKERMQSEHNKDIAQKVIEFNEHSESFINIHKFSANVENESRYIEELENLKQLFYTPVQYNIPAPTEDEIKQQLYNEAKQKNKSIAFWTLKARNNQYVNDNFEELYSKSVALWNSNKQSFDEEQLYLEAKKNAEFKQEYLDKRASLEATLSGDECFIGLAIDVWLGDVELPVNCNI